ncbi:hypothetical protein RhiLY_07802 [Ceratobasidium sp. AG-Ba]|nr:hypothetical protein RhiLY_07801 [Ceratobasidium sp. AG-Ba]QRW08803.1 hypothetical protein RhiLY_07802 [Ceratobasidium sp. AG-Ba]
MAHQLSANLVNTLKAYDDQLTQHHDQDKHAADVAEALGVEKSSQWAHATAYISTKQDQPGLNSLVVNSPINDVFSVAEGQSISVTGKLHYRRRSDLKGKQPVVTVFGSGTVIIRIGVDNAQSVFKGKWDGDAIQPTSQTGRWST